jgi:hypothetical protein
MESAQYQYSLGAIGDNSFQINKCARFFKTLIHMAANNPGAFTVKLAIRVCQNVTLIIIQS